MSSEEPSPGDRVRKALTEIASRQRPRPSPEFAAYLDELDAASFNLAIHLSAELKISCSVIPSLLPMIDRERSEAVLNFQIAELLEKLENDGGEDNDTKEGTS